MKKFGKYFQTEVRHYLLLRNKLEKVLREGRGLLETIRRKTPLEKQLIPLTDLLIEINRVTVDCFRSGYIASGLHQLRLAQEIVHKMWAMYIDPRMARKKKVSPSEVRARMASAGFPPWTEFYQQLCMVSHTNRDFLLNAYPVISAFSKVSDECEFFVEYYLMILNYLDQKALWVIFKTLKPRMGGDYQVLVDKYSDTETVVFSDWDIVHAKQDERFDT